MTPLKYDQLLTKCQILKQETVIRAKEANQRSKAKSKEAKHGAES